MMIEMLNEVLLLYCIMLVHCYSIWSPYECRRTRDLGMYVFDIILNHQMSFT